MCRVHVVGRGVVCDLDSSKTCHSQKKPICFPRVEARLPKAGYSPSGFVRSPRVPSAGLAESCRLTLLEVGGTLTHPLFPQGKVPGYHIPFAGWERQSGNEAWRPGLLPPPSPKPFLTHGRWVQRPLLQQGSAPLHEPVATLETRPGKQGAGSPGCPSFGRSGEPWGRQGGRGGQAVSGMTITTVLKATTTNPQRPTGVHRETTCSSCVKPCA